jgi:hypothetical protein
MDDLDRLFLRLAENIRTTFTEYLTRPFEVAEIYQTLVPYRHNRRELGIETNGDYEAALLRLLAGERGFLQVEPAVQEAMERELASPNPNTALFREFAASRVALAGDAPRVAEQLRQREQLGSAIGAAAAFGESSTSAAAGAPRAPERPAPAPAPPAQPHPSAPERVAPERVAPERMAPERMAASAPSRQPGETPPAAAAAPARGGAVTGAAAQGVIGGVCRYCSGALPQGRRTVFCPHCGQNLTIQRCPACGTELEISWKFCITCGRGVAGA